MSFIFSQKKKVEYSGGSVAGEEGGFLFRNWKKRGNVSSLGQLILTLRTYGKVYVLTALGNLAI